MIASYLFTTEYIRTEMGKESNFFIFFWGDTLKMI